MNLDTLRGILIGVSLGDALGAPHEFRFSKVRYTGKLEHEIKRINRFHGEIIHPVGSVTDDTQMTFALIKSLIKEQRYSPEDTVLFYESWAATSNMLGKNTRALFKGVKTYKGYDARYKKIFSEPMETWTQSNGSLMRCTPFVIFPGYDELIADCKLTNPHPINIGCSIIYSYLLKNIAIKRSIPSIDELYPFANYEPIIKVLDDVKNKVIRNVSSKAVKGWVCTALYCALWSLYNIGEFYPSLKYFIEQGGDTDTNAAIIGGLLGAKFTYAQFKDDPNIKTFFGINPELNNFDVICRTLLELSYKLYKI